MSMKNTASTATPAPPHLQYDLPYDKRRAVQAQAAKRIPTQQPPMPRPSPHLTPGPLVHHPLRQLPMVRQDAG